MQNRILGLIALLTALFPHSRMYAQEEEAHSYTLDSISVIGHKIRELSDFSKASDYEADTLLIENKSHASLADFIAQNTPYVVKQNGNGMMTTLSLRGTSASHTQAMWDDINISPLTMGQTDYSTLPVFFFERIGIHPGGESAVFGNGAIGGAVTLGTHSPLNESNMLSIQQNIGSYGNTFSGLKWSLGNQRIRSKTALFYHQCENDFHTTFRGETICQKNASYNDYGGLNETEIRLNDKHTLGGKLWFTKFNREIQPMLQNNEDPSKYEKIDDQSAKAVLTHEYDGDWLHWRSKMAWINDREHFKGDLIATHDIMVLSNVRKRIKKLLLELGGEIHYIKPEVYAYKAGTDEWRKSLYLLSQYTPHKRISLHGNLRQTWVSSLSIPFSPAFGFETRPIMGEQLIWTIGGNVARNTKAPTLNDRYWGDYANKELTAETAFNLEAKSKWELFIKQYNATLSATLYRNDVDNWIMWMPRGSVWKPTNIEEVLARGVEIETAHNFPIRQTKHKATFLYNHSFTEIQKGFSDMHPFLGHQMPLTPQNTFAAIWSATYKESDLTISGNYTGERTSSDIFDILKSYFLLDLSLNHTFHFPKKETAKKGQAITLSFQIDNLLDKEYQNLPFRGMPGRNYLAGIKWQIMDK